jgi:NADH-quinone oxidoreductase subunit F
VGVVERILPATPVTSLADHEGRGGGRSVAAARKLGPDAVIDVVEASGLRGRGGAGFPSGQKWRTVATNEAALGSTVVVNGAEGEPGSFKDRAILRANPYAVLEGALVAALAVGATQVIVALKRSFATEAKSVAAAIEALRGAGWCDEVTLSLFQGPAEYLYGEETALLEAIDGRPPFPRVAPPYRHGVTEITDSPDSGSTAELAGPTDESVAPPTLASNVETFANVPGIVADGADWFRSVGTSDSPGTIVCTVSGRTRRAGVAEMAMGTPIAEVVETIGGGAADGRHLLGLMSGVANSLVPAELFPTPASYEALAAIGSGLGAAGFIVFDDTTDPVAVAAGVARFLAVESCGQCTPCKRDGLTLVDHLARAARSDTTTEALDEVMSALETVADGARCNLARQQQLVIRSLLELFPDALRAHAERTIDGVDPEPIVPIADIVDGRAVLDERELAKQPDWTYDPVDSGKWPAERLDEHRVPEAL